MSKEDLLTTLKTTVVEAESNVENLKAELAQMESAENVDAEAVKGKKAEIKTANTTLKAATRELAKEQKRIEREQAKADKQAEREAAAQAKKDEAERKKKEREANRMPEVNGIRRPKPNTLCGKAWATMDRLSAELGQPVPIKELLEATDAEGLNPGNVKAEYARWRKFNGVTGRITLPKAEEAKADTKEAETDTAE